MTRDGAVLMTTPDDTTDVEAAIQIARSACPPCAPRQGDGRVRWQGDGVHDRPVPSLSLILSLILAGTVPYVLWFVYGKGLRDLDCSCGLAPMSPSSSLATF